MDQLGNSPTLDQLNSKKRSLESQTFWIEALVVLFGISVVIGLIGEARSKIQDNKEIFEWVVTIGVGCEVVAGILSLYKLRSSISLQTIIDLENEKESNRLRLDFENAEAALSKLADQHAPRKISDEAKEVLISRLSPFSGSQFQLLQLGLDDNEAREFAESLGAILNSCGWLGSVHANASFWGIQAPPNGVSIKVFVSDCIPSPEVESNATLAMTNLWITLKALNIRVTGISNQLQANAPSGLISIHVAAKP